MSNTKKSQRAKSDAEFYTNAKKLRREMRDLMLRDFGIKKKILEHHYNIDLDEDAADTLRELQAKYHMDETDGIRIAEVIGRAKYDAIEFNKYPEWIIAYYREALLETLKELLMNIRYANSIRIMPINPEGDYNARRQAWNRAIANCFQLNDWMSDIKDYFTCDTNKFDTYLDRIEREIALLQGVRQSDNKVLKSAQRERDKKLAAESLKKASAD